MPGFSADPQTLFPIAPQLKDYHFRLWFHLMGSYSMDFMRAPTMNSPQCCFCPAWCNCWNQLTLISGRNVSYFWIMQHTIKVKGCDLIFQKSAARSCLLLHTPSLRHQLKNCSPISRHSQFKITNPRAFLCKVIMEAVVGGCLISLVVKKLSVGCRLLIVHWFALGLGIRCRS